MARGFRSLSKATEHAMILVCRVSARYRHELTRKGSRKQQPAPVAWNHRCGIQQAIGRRRVGLRVR